MACSAPIRGCYLLAPGRRTEKSASCTTFSAALKRAYSALPYSGFAPMGACWFALAPY
ncbi:hypothetical protein CLOBOL_03007 [Enterocloster bolteae ATCC BAA-613]|uniref:Uncharacterized protein n=1 Tax=Enterocloster bolteae (strain ATCC BAA-613 / DSM 15670 / CCUG 46953 / JCM 12243 / WAL 16351) TaxID=411902 RepID=A8RRI1_ENTBW|nr:hypothetical protein CLOBOL_03007 [Enterocloster bolteae ATCC BAA-613]